MLSISFILERHKGRRCSGGVELGLILAGFLAITDKIVKRRRRKEEEEIKRRY